MKQLKSRWNNQITINYYYYCQVCGRFSIWIQSEMKVWRMLSVRWTKKKIRTVLYEHSIISISDIVHVFYPLPLYFSMFHLSTVILFICCVSRVILCFVLFWKVNFRTCDRYCSQNNIVLHKSFNILGTCKQKWRTMEKTTK